MKMFYSIHIWCREPWRSGRVISAAQNCRTVTTIRLCAVGTHVPDPARLVAGTAWRRQRLGTKTWISNWFIWQHPLHYLHPGIVLIILLNRSRHVKEIIDNIFFCGHRRRHPFDRPPYSEFLTATVHKKSNRVCTKSPTVFFSKNSWLWCWPQLRTKLKAVPSRKEGVSRVTIPIMYVVQYIEKIYVRRRDVLELCKKKTSSNSRHWADM